MIVEFKLTTEQKRIAAKVLAEVAADTSAWDAADAEGLCAPAAWCGDLLGYTPKHPALNPDQLLELSKCGGFVRYSGQRCPLWQDGGLAVLREIAGGVLAELEVVDYSTSDKRLKWHETLEDAIGRLTEVEQVFALNAQIKDHGWAGQSYFGAAQVARRLADEYEALGGGGLAYRRLGRAGSVAAKLALRGHI